MSKITKKIDSFEDILNSIKPVKFKYSNKSYQFDKIFNKFGIESLERKLYAKRRPPMTFKDSALYQNIEKTYGLSKEAFGYLEDINGVKKMPIKIESKGIDFDKKLYNAQLERKINEFLLNIKEEIKESKNINTTNKIENKKIKKRISSGLDPGYYHPNYNFVKRRIPAFGFGKSRKSENHKETVKSSEDKNKKSQKKQENNTEGNKHFDIKNEKVSFDNYNKNANMNNQLLKLNLNDETKNESNFKSPSRNKIEKEDNISVTQRTILPKINIDNAKNNENKQIIKKIKPQSKLRKIFSSPNIISFKKMRGRYDGIKRIGKKESEIPYKPNYNFNAPHIPSFLFKSSDIKKDYKKYKIGKLIRSYVVDPYKYEIMDINESNDKSFNKKEKTKINIDLKKSRRNKIKK